MHMYIINSRLRNSLPQLYIVPGPLVAESPEKGKRQGHDIPTPLVLVRDIS